MSEGFKLSSEEKKRILAGDHSAIKRDEDPGKVEGHELVLRRRRAHRVPIRSRKLFSDHQPPIVGTQEIPEQRLFWITLEKPKRHRKGHWQIHFKVNDHRERVRLLRAGGPPGPAREPGLRTRPPNKPRPKGEGVGTYTDETARGYGGGVTADENEAVDDDELRRQRVEADNRRAVFLEEEQADEQAAKQQRALRQKIKESVRDLGPTAAPLFLARVEQAMDEAKGELENAA